MSKVKQIFLEEQQEFAQRGNPEFENHIKLLKETPPPAVALQQSAKNSLNELLEKMGVPSHQQALIRGFVHNLEEAVRIEYLEMINDLKSTNISADHAMMLSTDPENAIS